VYACTSDQLPWAQRSFGSLPLNSVLGDQPENAHMYVVVVIRDQLTRILFCSFNDQKRRMPSLLLTVAALLVCCCHVAYVSAGQPPYAASEPDFGITSEDRLYLSAQSSNAISVIDPSTNTLLGLIKPGGQLEETLSAVYRGQSLVHGMGFSPDAKTLAAVAVASNAVIFVNTANNTVKHVQYVGRAPHEVMWTPNGR
jgi:DNA-binding beta-propeller fold protein YncE